MKKSSIVFLAISVMVLVCALIFLAYAMNLEKTNGNNSDMMPQEEVSETQDIEDVVYTDFTFYKKDGTEVKLSSFADKPIVILFWNPKEEKSVEELNKLNDFYDTYKDKVSFVVLATCPTDEMKEEFETGVDFEIYYDLYKEGVYNYKINEVPSMIYITKEQTVFNPKSGFSTSDAIEANLDILIDNI